MIQENDAPQPTDAENLVERRRRWLGLPLAEPREGTMDEILKALPHFGRQPFAMASVNSDDVGVNPFLDMVYRLPSKQDERPIPVGVVSKNYRLVDHHHVLRTVEEALAGNQINTSQVDVRAEWTINGERARFSVIFPSDERFQMSFRDKDEMRFRIEIFNSVEGSCRFMVVAGWLRFVCSNGLILGTALMQLRQQHRQQLEIEEVGRLLREALQSVGNDKQTFMRWLGTRIEHKPTAQWVDNEVRELWGIKAAVRVLGIVLEGCDVEPVGDLRERNPSEVATRKREPVPGVNGPVTDLFGVSQVLSWVAGQRADMAEDLKWRGQVADLMGSLIKHSGRIQQSTFT